MNKKIKARWLKALRSGDYEQTRKVLHRYGDGFCCLGVLCDLHRKSTKRSGWKQGIGEVVSYLGDRVALPANVSKWAGLTQCDPIINNKETTLSDLNDSGKSFRQIAKVIEKRL